jgi:diguanylate cyclase (GGDEF)-like protein
LQAFHFPALRQPGSAKRLLRGLLAVGLCACTAALPALQVSPELLAVDRNPQLSLQRATQAVALLAAQADAAPAERMQAHLLAASAATALGSRALAARHIEASRRLAQQVADPFGMAMAEAIQAMGQADTDKLDECVASARSAILLGRTITDEMSQAYIRETAAWALSSGASHYAEAEPHFVYALSVYRRHGDLIRTAAAQAGMASIYDGLQDTPSSAAARRQAFALLDQVDAPYLKSWIGWAQGQDALNAHDPKAAQIHFRQSLDNALQLQDTASVAAARLGLGIAAVMLQDWQPAERYLAQSQPVLLERDYFGLWAMGQSARARAWVAMERPGFDELLDSASRRMAAAPDNFSKLRFLEYRAQTHVAAGHWSKAAATLQDMLDIERRLALRARKTQLVELGVRYEMGKKDEENLRLRLRDDLNQSTLREQSANQQLLGALLALALLTLGFGAYLLFNQVQKRRYYATLASIDVLTGAPNRRAILDHLAALAIQGEGALVAMLDIDHFKGVNDRFGHDVGDEVLKAFYRAAAQGQQQGERIGRIGGEEWLVVQAGAAPAAQLAEQLFQRIRAQLQLQAIPGLPENEAITFSMGVAQLSSLQSVTDVLASADRALYRAKNAGRDRYALAAAQALAA